MKPEEKKKTSIKIDTSKIKEVLLNFVVPLIAFGLSLVLILIVVYPNFKNLSVVKEELNQKQQLKKVLEDKLVVLNRLVDFKSVVDEDSDLANKVLVNEVEVPKLLDQVNQIATNSGMNVTTLSYSYGGSGTSDIGAEKKVSYSNVSVALGTDSSFDQLVIFLKAIENAARFVSIPNFRYSETTNSEGESKLGSSFSIDSPYLFVQSTAVTDEPVTLDISSQSFVDFINMIKGLKYYEFLNPNIEVVKTQAPTDETPKTDATDTTPPTE